MTDYQKRKEQLLFEELRRVYPELAPPKKKRDAKQDIIDLFGEDDEIKPPKGKRQSGIVKW